MEKEYRDTILKAKLTNSEQLNFFKKIRNDNIGKIKLIKYIYIFK
jgi:hypothetical protein